VSRPGASGSGVIVRREGIILTNAHVVGTARQVEIGLADGRRVQAEVIGRDPSIDIAVVRMPVTNAPVAPVGDSDRLEVGQDAIAIGNPLGLDRTVTSGVVSAVNRNPVGIALEGLIQTDAAISPGNSGGPLLDSRGQVIGINTAVLSAPGASGLGFAIPINLANDIVQQVLTTGRVRRVYVGIQYADIAPEMAEQFDLPAREGIIVGGVVPRSPAAQAGIRPEDIITSINDVPVARGGDLRRELRGLTPGQVARLGVVRRSGRTTVNVRLAEASE
jgi:S1-C subfamily serine protease